MIPEKQWREVILQHLRDTGQTGTYRACVRYVEMHDTSTPDRSYLKIITEVVPVH